MLLHNIHAQKKSKTEKELADKELTETRGQLEAYSRALEERDALIENFTAEIGKLQSQENVTARADVYDHLQKLQRATILTDEQWNNFRETFEHVHPGYIGRIKERLPNLTPAEMRIMVLYKLKMDNKQMSAVLGIDTSTVRYHKYNLRKKIEKIAGEPLESVVQKL